eukprot:gene17925-58331_t
MAGRILRGDAVPRWSPLTMAGRILRGDDASNLGLGVTVDAVALRDMIRGAVAEAAPKDPPVGAIAAATLWNAALLRAPEGDTPAGRERREQATKRLASEVAAAPAEREKVLAARRKRDREAASMAGR